MKRKEIELVLAEWINEEDEEEGILQTIAHILSGIRCGDGFGLLAKSYETDVETIKHLGRCAGLLS